MQRGSRSFWGGMPLSTWFDRPTRPRIVPTVVIILGVALFGLIALTPAPAILTIRVHAHQTTTALQSSATATSTQTTAQTITGQTTTGNGGPSGPHYDQNIHGIVQGGSASTSSNGHDIFVPLQGKCPIILSPGSFHVLDANCLDGSAAFQLPNPVAITTTTTLTTTNSLRVKRPSSPACSRRAA